MSMTKRYETSRVPWLRDTKFLHELEKDSVDSEIIDEELRSIQLDVTTYVVVQSVGPNSTPLTPVSYTHLTLPTILRV